MSMEMPDNVRQRLYIVFGSGLIQANQAAQAYEDLSLLECALTLARDLAYIWPRCPRPILPVCNSSIRL